MSAAASWSYTAKATIWPAQARASDWDGSAAFGPPVVIDCDYSSEAKVMRDAKGEEFVSALSVFTEHAGQAGDMLALGDHGSTPNPVAAARAVRVVQRFGDTFQRAADDYTLVTS